MAKPNTKKSRTARLFIYISLSNEERSRVTDLPPRTSPLLKLAPGPFEVHSKGAEPRSGISGSFVPHLADALTVHPICQEELYDPGRDVSINPNENSILTP